MSDLWVWSFNPNVGLNGELENRKVLKYEKQGCDFIAITDGGVKLDSEDGWRLNREEAVQAAIDGMGRAITETEELIELNKKYILEKQDRIEHLKKCIAHAKEVLK